MERRDGKEGVETVSPQQPDGISNIRSWNAGNAGQSDRERGWKDIKRRRGDMGKGGTAKESEGSTLAVFVNVKIQSHCLRREWHAMEQITNSATAWGCGSYNQQLRPSVVLWVARGLVLHVLFRLTRARGYVSDGVRLMMTFLCWCSTATGA